MKFSELDLIASITRDSYYDFVQEFWDTVVPNEIPIWNWHIEYLCNELQTMAERVRFNKPKLYDLIVNIAPGSTKSIIFSIFFTPWVWTFFPNARVICASYTHDLAMDLSRKSRDVIKSDKYKAVFPHIELREDQDTKSYFMNTLGGSRYCAGVGGSVTGMHGHFLIVDDPIDPTKAISEADLKTANRWMAETLPTRKVDKAVVPTILIMQRLHQNDCTTTLIEQAEKAQKIEGGPLKLKRICLPAELTENVKPVELIPYYKDGLLDPIRLSKSILSSFMAALGEFGYAGQFLQSPIPLGGGMFKVSRIQVEEVLPTDYILRVRFWDKAGTAGGQGAYTVGTLMGWIKKSKRFLVIDVIRGRWDSAQREDIIRQTAIIDGKGVIIGIEQEPGSGGKESAEATVRNLAGWNVIVDKPSGSDSSKISRADPFSVQVNNGNVSILKALWNLDWLSEISYFPYSKYKDQADSGSGAFNVLTGKIRRRGPMFRRKEY